MPVLNTPKQIYETSLNTFYRNDNPQRIMVAHLNSFEASPKSSFQKNRSELLNPKLIEEERMKIDDKLKAYRSEEYCKNCEDKLTESMKNENWVLQSEYINERTLVTYLFNNMQYQTTPT